MVGARELAAVVFHIYVLFMLSYGVGHALTHGHPVFAVFFAVAFLACCPLSPIIGPSLIGEAR